ncbi:MAG: anti-sigma factor [Chloroflexota bacterium]|nr:anti-sigma factor [Chloroflexota bacterium]
MTDCCNSGQLRLYMEGPGSMPDTERATIAAHLASCEQCSAVLNELRGIEASVTTHLAALAPEQPPHVQGALMKMRAKLREQSPAATGYQSDRVGRPPAGASLPHTNGDKYMRTFTQVRRGHRGTLFAGGFAALVLVSLFAFPSFRAAADTLLQSFRAKSVVFVPVSADRLQQLRGLATDPTALFIGKPSIVGASSNTEVKSYSDAARLAGFTPEQPSVLPSGPAATQIAVHGNTQVQVQINVDTVRLLLTELGITDVTLPDTLGSSPITASVPPFVETTYTGDNYKLALVQGRSPTVSLPPGVDLAQLGRAGLRLIGMQPEQADALSRQTDWSSTLVVPFPAGLSTVLQVKVGDAPGMLVRAGSDVHGTGGRQSVLYWQRGEQFYVLTGEGRGITDDALLVTARSVK